MDAQKISEAAATIKKADLAAGWFERIQGPSNYSRGVVIDTQGNSTSFPGHGEAKNYLRQAMEIHRQSIIDYARELAAADKVKAQAAIRAEASGDGS